MAKKGASARLDRIPGTPFRRFLAEVRRRKIIETSAAFIGGGWLFIEFVHWYLIDHFHFPERLLDIAFVTVAGAYLGTLVWRWFRAGGPKPRRRHPEALIIPVLAAATIVLDLVLWLKPGNTLVPAETPRWLNSIAVMPFADLSRAGDQDYFCEGMAEDIRTKLTRLNPRLKVIARYAMLPYKDAGGPFRDVARELGVETFLEGSVQREGDRIRVNAQLINARSGAHVWADIYDKTAASIFDVQDEISLAIVKSLELKLAPGAELALKAGRPENLEAYLNVARGESIISTAYVLTRREEDFAQALEMYRKAVELDPEYAPSYAGLAWAYTHHYTFTGKMEHAFLALENAKKAFDLDPDRPESLAAGGFYYAERKDMEKAFACFRRALEANPNMMEIIQLVGLTYQRLGLHDQAIRFFQRNLEISPGYLFAIGNLAFSYMALGDLGRAEPLLRKVMALAPGHPTYIVDYADLLIRTGKTAEAGKVLDEAAAINLGTNRAVYPRCRALLDAVQGRKDEALSVDRSPEVLAVSGMAEEAIGALEVIARGTPPLKNYEYFDLLHNPYLRSLRGDPRFQGILASRKAFHDGLVKNYGDLDLDPRPDL